LPPPALRRQAYPEALVLFVLTDKTDAHADRVCGLLAARGARFERFDPGDIPTRATVTLAFAPRGRMKVTVRVDDRLLDFGMASTIWYRRPSRPQADPNLNDTARTFVTEATAAFLRDLYSALDCQWFPGPPDVLSSVGQRLFQLRLATDLGFQVPETLVTNDARAFLAFHQRAGGAVVTKMLSDNRRVPTVADHVNYCQPVTNRDLARVRTVRSCPSFFQRYIPKRTELRVTVVEGKLFPAEIDSQVTNRTQVDWRRYDASHTPHRATELPDAIGKRCLALVEALGLRFAAIDLIRTPDDDYVFLEANPNGQYLWIERAIGAPISAAICDALVTPAATARQA
jgi:hypothetical protein